MRTRFLFIGFSALMIGLLTDAQTINVTPASLDGWSITGATREVLAASPSLTIPAGAQLARSFPATNLSINLKTQPLVGVASADWPVLELGSAALLFVRGTEGGKLLVVIGDNAPVALPVSFALDADGRAIEPLTLSVSRHDQTLTIAAGGETKEFALNEDMRAAVEVVIFSGSGVEWSFDTLEIALTPTATVTNPDDGTAGTGSGQPGVTAPVVSEVKLPVSSRPQAMGSDTNFDPPVNPAGARTAGTNTAIELEVFTPGSIRRGRAEVVRASAAQTQIK